MEGTRINIIIMGSTGMVGEGVLHECLADERIKSIVLLNRHPSGINHPKVREVVKDDLFSISDEGSWLEGLDACFFCIGTTSVGKSEAEYYRSTHDLTLSIAVPLQKKNPDMTFCYISAYGADISEKGKTMWARVKGKTENDLNNIGFRKFYSFRPFLLTPTKGLTKTHGFYKFIAWLFPIGRLIYPKGFCTLKELGFAMIRVACDGYEKTIIEPKDIVIIASK